jgi:transposase
MLGKPIQANRERGRPMRKVYVGIDVGSKRCAASAIDARGGILDSSVFKTSGSNLVEFVQRQKGEVRVLMEEGELAGWVYRTLLPHAKSVEASDPRRNAWIAKASRKDDRTDALKLAELLRLGSYSPVYHPEDDYMAAFKSAVKHYERIAREVSRMMVRIKARLRSQGVITSGMKVYGARGRLHAIRTVDNQAVREILEQVSRPN